MVNITLLEGPLHFWGSFPYCWNILSHLYPFISSQLPPVGNRLRNFAYLGTASNRGILTSTPRKETRISWRIFLLLWLRQSGNGGKKRFLRKPPERRLRVSRQRRNRPKSSLPGLDQTYLRKEIAFCSRNRFAFNLLWGKKHLAFTIWGDFG